MNITSSKFAKLHSKFIVVFTLSSVAFANLAFADDSIIAKSASGKRESEVPKSNNSADKNYTKKIKNVTDFVSGIAELSPNKGVKALGTISAVGSRVTTGLKAGASLSDCMRDIPDGTHSSLCLDATQKGLELVSSTADITRKVLEATGEKVPTLLKNSSKALGTAGDMVGIGISGNNLYDAYRRDDQKEIYKYGFEVCENTLDAGLALSGCPIYPVKKTLDAACEFASDKSCLKAFVDMDRERTQRSIDATGCSTSILWDTAYEYCDEDKVKEIDKKKQKERDLTAESRRKQFEEIERKNEQAAQIRREYQQAASQSTTNMPQDEFDMYGC